LSETSDFNMKLTALHKMGYETISCPLTFHNQCSNSSSVQ